MKRPCRAPLTRPSRSTKLIVLLLLFLPFWLPAHESHDSIAEATLNPETRRLEVTLSVHATDLERALSLALDRPIALDQAAAETIDPLITDYLVKAFQIKSAQGTPLPLEWIGKESAGNAAHPLLLLHFEVPLPASRTTLTLHQSTFCELHADQINLIEFRHGDHKQTLGFSPQHHARTIDL